LTKLILLFASQPLNGQVLPGLVPPLLPFQAALLYHAMLRDQLRACAEVPGAKLRICFAPGLLPGSFEGDLQWEIQRGGSLSERLQSAFRSAFRIDGARVLAIGHEACFVPGEALIRSFEALNSNTAVIGKGLIGLSRHLPSLLQDEPHHFEGRAGVLGLKYALVDGSLSFEDLGELRHDLAKNAGLSPLSELALASMA
jgi:glycosyltransferase A (GT-A) superfamily protein (DUF2064 family)